MNICCFDVSEIKRADIEGILRHRRGGEPACYRRRESYLALNRTLWSCGLARIKFIEAR